MSKNLIKYYLVDLALDTKDFIWLKEILNSDYNMTPHHHVTAFGLENRETRELAEIWDKLNEWEWDDRLGEPPFRFYEIPDYSKDQTKITKRTYTKPIFDKITSLIGEKECLRWNHINNKGITNEQFEDWWEKKGKELL